MGGRLHPCLLFQLENTSLLTAGCAGTQSGMATQDDVRRICSKLPGALEGEGRFGFSVENKGKMKGFLWSWAERVHPKKARVPNDAVLVVVVPSLAAKEVILGTDSAKFFTEPHYNGFPAVHVRLEAISVVELEDLVIETRRSKAPPTLVQSFDGS